MLRRKSIRFRGFKSGDLNTMCNTYIVCSARHHHYHLLILFTSGSKITLTSSPSSVQPSLTKSLNISCSLHDTSLPSGALIGRSVTNTSYDVTHVTSILIMRDGSDVASITPYTAAKSSLTNVKVSGEIDEHSNIKG